MYSTFDVSWCHLSGMSMEYYGNIIVPRTLPIRVRGADSFMDRGNFSYYTKVYNHDGTEILLHLVTYIYNDHVPYLPEFASVYSRDLDQFHLVSPVFTSCKKCII